MRVAQADPRATYVARMHRVLEHIDRHLDQPLDLATLAAVAHFSPFHFHRLFAAWMGERLGDYLRRRRLQVAATMLLTTPSAPVLDVALTVGFGSSEAFARAFRLRFGCTPTQWRARHERKPDQANGNLDQAAAALAGNDGVLFTPRFEDAPMNVTLQDLPAMTVAYMRHIGPYGDLVTQFWQTRFDPWLHANGLDRVPLYGISHDDPTIVDPQDCRFDAAVEVSAGFVVGHGVFKTTLPGGRYAVLPFQGGADAIGPAWRTLMRDWLPASGWQLDNRPCFERYPPGGGFDLTTRTFVCDICIPVAPL